MPLKVVELTCSNCKQAFERRPGKFNTPDQKRFYCSRQCWREGKAKDPSPQHLKEAGRAWNQKQSLQAAKRKIERTEQLTCSYCGKHFERIYRWKKREKVVCSRTCGGLSHERWGSYWQKNNGSRLRESMTQMMRRRFVEECALCGWKEEACDAHHITPVAEGGLNIVSNMILLCPNHHRLADRRKISTDVLRDAAPHMKRIPGVPDRAYQDYNQNIASITA